MGHTDIHLDLNLDQSPWAANHLIYRGYAEPRRAFRIRDFLCSWCSAELGGLCWASLGLLASLALVRVRSVQTRFVLKTFQNARRREN